MKIKKWFLLLMPLVLSSTAYCQSSEYEYYITTNCNLYLPGGTTNKGVYPILWYDKTVDPKLLIGGFGAGFSVLKSIKSKLSLKGQGNISKHSYWNEPMVLRDTYNQPFAQTITGSSDFMLGLIATAQYFLTNKISVGTGLGGQLLLVSLTRLPEINNISSGSVAVNYYYKPFVPVLPFELSLKLKKTLFNIRYEYGLLNRFKSGISEYEKDKFSLLTFEVGFKIK